MVSHTTQTIRGVVLIFGGCYLVACQSPSTPTPSTTAAAPVAASTHDHAHSAAAGSLPTMDATKPQNYPGLHNCVAYTPALISGGWPEGEEAFETLHAWGIKTIISVDGAQPNVEAAQKHGMRYVHLPIGYDGFDDARKMELARAVRDLPGPIYLHCHHGKHRSAGAAGAVAVTLGQSDTSTAISRMKVSGTSPDYKGLYLCVNESKPASTSQIDKASNQFPSHYKTSDFVQTMVEVDEANEHLKEVEQAGWKAPKSHPDLVPAALAGMLADHLRLCAEQPECQKEGKEFLALLAKSAAFAQKVEDLIIDPKATNEERSAAFKSLAATCKECHVKHRD